MPTTTAPAGIPTATELARLAESVVVEGFAAHDGAVADLVRVAHRSGVSEVLLAVLADVDAPTVARERALGLVLVALDNPSVRSTAIAPPAATLSAATLTAKGAFADVRRPTVDTAEFADDRRPTTAATPGTSSDEPADADRPLVATGPSAA